jgi:hypothetical protein
MSGCNILRSDVLTATMYTCAEKQAHRILASSMKGELIIKRHLGL